MLFWYMMQTWWRGYFGETKAIAGVEASFIFPIMLVILFGTLDVGRAIMTNQKTIRASQVAADLITRHIQVSDADIDDAVNAATLSLQPYTMEGLEFDIISIRFQDDGSSEIVWRETTSSMTPITGLDARVSALSSPGSGVVMVVARYTYEPIISGFVIGSVYMQEIAFAHGRRSEIVCRDGVSGCA